MLGFSSPTDKKEKLLKMAKESISDQPLLLSDPILEYPRSESSSTKSTLLARIRQAGVTDAILLALSEQGLVIVERKSA